MKLIVISSSKTLENEAEIITKLFESGLETFHLRKHKHSTYSMKQLIKKIPAAYHNRIIIHSHHGLARKFKLKGIHLTKSHLKDSVKTWVTIKILRFSNPDLEITTSFNNIGQLLEKSNPYKYSYVFLSPVFDSLSSKFQSGFTEHSLASAMRKTTYKVIARGGVDMDAIAKGHKIGFQGLAFYTAIWKKKDPNAEFNKVIEKFKELNITVE